MESLEQQNARLQAENSQLKQVQARMQVAVHHALIKVKTTQDQIGEVLV